jgi:hypothetical protein
MQLGVPKTTVIATVEEVPVTVQIRLRICLRSRPEINVRLTVASFCDS